MFFSFTVCRFTVGKNIIICNSLRVKRLKEQNLKYLFIHSLKIASISLHAKYKTNLGPGATNQSSLSSEFIPWPYWPRSMVVFLFQCKSVSLFQKCLYLICIFQNVWTTWPFFSHTLFGSNHISVVPPPFLSNAHDCVCIFKHRPMRRTVICINISHWNCAWSP